jgi:hypothetical protein
MRRKRLRQAKTVAVGCDRLPEAFHGKEGVDGSSPSEGLHKSPGNRHLMLPVLARFRPGAGTRRVHFGTGGHSGARATPRDTPRTCSRYSLLTTYSENSCKQAFGVVRTGAALTPSWLGRESGMKATPHRVGERLEAVEAGSRIVSRIVLGSLRPDGADACERELARVAVTRRWTAQPLSGGSSFEPVAEHCAVSEPSETVQ